MSQVAGQDEPITPEPDTEVDIRTYRIRRNRRPRRALPHPTDKGPELGGTPKGRNPGNTLRAAPLSSVIIREAMVKRAQDRADPPAPLRGPVLTEIAFLRSAARQRLVRIAPDAFEVRGTAFGRGVLAVGIDGLIFRVPVLDGQAATDSAAHLAARIGSRYQTEIVADNGDRIIVRIRASHT